MKETTSPEAMGLLLALGENIRLRRQAYGLTQTQLAEAAGLAPIASTICDLERGRMNPTFALLVGIAHALQCHVTDLFPGPISGGVKDGLNQALALVSMEYMRATQMWGRFQSAHEGYAIILEELDELWDEVKKNDRERSPEAVRKEAVQVTAMGLRFLVDVCLRKGVQP